MGLLERAGSGVRSVYDELTLCWQHPAKGNFVSYREVLNLGVGGMGQQLVTLLLGYMGLGAANTLLGSTLGLAPVHLQIMATVQTVLGIFFTMIRSKMVDNTHTRMGKFRPYIAVMGIPLVLLTAIFMFLPFHTFSYSTKLVTTFCFTLALNFCTPLFSENYNMLIAVITPNSEERTKVITINTFLFSVAPTITGFSVPLFAGLFEGTYTNINLYRYVAVPIGILGVLLNLFAAFGTKERIVAPAEKPQTVKIWKDAVTIFKNKYWWILNIAGIVGFTEGAFGVILSWMFIYGLQNMAAYSLVNTILGTASSIGMFIAPFVLLRFGNRKVLLGHNIFNIFLIVGMMINYNSPILFFVFYYFNNVVNSLALIYNPEFFAEMKDYQQFKFRKRLDWTFGVSGLILMPLSLATGYFMPFVYETFGLSTNYNILYDPAVRGPLFYVICMLSVIGALLNLIPYFFFDMSAEKHKWMMNCLRLRSAAVDKAEGKITPQEVKTICEVLDEFEYLDGNEFNVAAAKEKYRQAKRGKAGKSEVKALKKAYRQCKRQAAEKKEIYYFTEELRYFESEAMRRRLAFCRSVTELEPGAFRTLSAARVDTIAAKSPDRREEHKFRRAVERLQKLSAEQFEQMHRCAQEVERDSEKARDKKILSQAREYNDRTAFYHTCAELLREYEAMEQFGDIRQEYVAACEAVAEEDRIAQEKQEAEAAEKAAEKAERKRARREKKGKEGKS